MAVVLEEALAILLSKIQVQGKSHVPLAACYERVLAEDIIAEIDFPPFDRSPLDGYAVRKNDVQYASLAQPVVLTQVDNVPAGYVAYKRVEAGQAIRIMTGAQIPEGADAVIRLEDVAVEQNKVSIFAPVETANICRQGEEIHAGKVVLQQGIVLRDGALGLLAMLGHAAPLVYNQPKVAILATGTELIGVDQPLLPGKIRNSNNYMLMAKVREAGCLPILLGQVCDDIELIEQKIAGHENISMYITTGGASVGDYDLMERLFAKLHIPMLFTRIAMKPGMPVMAGCLGNMFLVALSGNPASANVSFETLLRPVLRKMAGATVIERPISRVKLTAAFNKPSLSRRFIWARLEYNAGILYAEPMGFQGNGMLSGMLPANALLDIPANSDCLSLGTEVVARLLSD